MKGLLPEALDRGLTLKVGKGIFLKAPSDAKGTVNVKLTNITVRDTGYHGAYISDCTSGDECGAGQSGGQEPGLTALMVVPLHTVFWKYPNPSGPSSEKVMWKPRSVKTLNALKAM